MKRILLTTLLLVAFFVLIYTVGSFFLTHHDQVGPDVTSDETFVTGFISKDYPEIKDLGKTFLSLLIGVFVASITFSEKIVGHQASPRIARAFLFTCWGLILASIAFIGAGICFFYYAYYQGIYEHKISDDYPAQGYLCYACSGFSFGTALVCMLFAAISSFLFPKKV
jgi:hypothetical protein